MKRTFLVFCFTNLLVLASLSAVPLPDSVLTLQQAKVRLLKKNFYLLAAYYEINQSEAQLIQAKVWNNPNISWSQEAYNTEQNKYFRARNQYEAQISQTISIAGKHTNTVKLARINVEITKAQFEDVMRGLIMDLVSTYNDLAAAEEKSTLYTEVLSNYEKLMTGIEKELQVGAISVIENLRIKTEYISVKADALDNSNQKELLLAQLRTLLQYPKDTLVRVEQKLPLFNSSFVVDSLVRQAVSLRPDLKATRLYQQYQHQNLKLQRSQAVPDITIGYDYDKGGNYIRNYSGVVVQMPLPIFDRNQGRIKEVKSNIEQSSLQLEYLKATVSNQVVAAYNQYKQNSEGLLSYSPDYLQKLDQLNQNKNTFFQKRNISLLEFIDYQRIYVTTKLQLIELRQLYLNSVNQLNFNIGTQLIEY